MILDQLTLLLLVKQQMFLIFNYTFSKNDIRKKFETAQPIELEFNFFEDVPAWIHGYALVITNKLVSISSDGQQHFELI